MSEQDTKPQDTNPSYPEGECPAFFVINYDGREWEIGPSLLRMMCYTGSAVVCAECSATRSKLVCHPTPVLTEASFIEGISEWSPDKEGTALTLLNHAKQMAKVQREQIALLQEADALNIDVSGASFEDAKRRVAEAKARDKRWN